MPHNIKVYMDYKINFEESIPDMIERLKQEHVQFNLTLNKITKYNEEDNINKAIETIHDMSQPIIKHAVEEEARIMRVIMHNAKEASTNSIKIMQEHNWVVDFLKHRVASMEDNNYLQQNKQDKQYQQKTQNEINGFVTNLKNHFEERTDCFSPCIKSRFEINQIFKCLSSSSFNFI
jgi:GTP-binding protein EngB required for normal cell division